MTQYHYYWGEAFDELQLAFHIRSADYATEQEFEAAVDEAEAFMDGFVGEVESGPFNFDADGRPVAARADGMSWATFRQIYVEDGAPTPFKRRR
ncbi:MAG: hypothetical protein HOU81_05840 [Hamadaea sp.]|uniref:hypothetical protein n=1 Tax=Hamadaea sp. TaxID=2024425 RepID=UPI0017D82514|nr:hypothetical protein [Hamadaea sp.]NUR70320.1 hypothetical protein [Hamadaea sp.]NUT21958.1 hypothetical protein [Hamadaea sp.]